MDFELLILGSNAAAFAHRRHHTSQLLSIQNKKFLLDCGEGTQLLLKKYKVGIAKIDHIFISHLHGDHYFGLIGLISTMHLFGRKKDLVLVGPPGLAEIIGLQLRYSETSLGFKIDFREFTPDTHEVIFDLEMLQIMTIPMDHRVPCSGFLFREKPKPRRINRSLLSHYKLSKLEIIELKKGNDVLNDDGSLRYKNKELTLDSHPSYSYAYCSDTRYKPELRNILQDADLMYHEATFANDMRDRAGSTFHSTAAEAAQLAKDAGVGKLLLGHFSARYKELDAILEEANAIFEKAELAIEGKKFRPDEK